MDERELLDKFEIQEWMTRYAHAVNAGDWETIRSLFVADAIFDLEESGVITGPRDEVIAVLEKTMGMLAWTQGFASNVLIELDGDAATVKTQMLRAMQLPGVDGPSFAGSYYHHELVRTDDGWRGRRFREEPIWMTNPPSGHLH